MRIIRKNRKNIMRHYSKIAILLASTAFAAPAVAEVAADGERDYLPADIVVKGERIDGYGNEDGSTGTKTPTPLIDVPQAVSFITEDQLEDQSIRQLNDALRYVPGISMDPVIFLYSVSDFVFFDAVDILSCDAAIADK